MLHAQLKKVPTLSALHERSEQLISDLREKGIDEDMARRWAQQNFEQLLPAHPKTECRKLLVGCALVHCDYTVMLSRRLQSRTGPAFGACKESQVNCGSATIMERVFGVREVLASMCGVRRCTVQFTHMLGTLSSPLAHPRYCAVGRSAAVSAGAHAGKGKAPPGGQRGFEALGGTGLGIGGV